MQMLERVTKAIGDTTRVTLDLSNPIWLDVGETITTVVNLTASLGASGWTTQQPPQTPPVTPYDPTPLTILSHAIVTGVAGASSAVQVFVQSGTPGNVYTVSFIANGSTGRAITGQITVQISGTPPTPPNTGFPPVGVVSPYLPLAGGTLTGPLMLFETPVAASEAATKSYVDTETTRAEAAEATLTTNLTTTNTNLTTTNTNLTTTNTNLAAETTRAEAAEATLTTNLATEVTRATAAEAVLLADFKLSNDGGRNLIHNSMFRVQQRGAGPFTTSVYTADRWLQSLATSTMSTTVVSLGDTDRASIGDESATSAIICVVGGTSGAGDFALLAQRIEGVRRLSGRTATLSFWAKSSSGTPKIGVDFRQNFGAGGSPSATVTGIGIGATTALTTNWNYYTFNVTFPSTAGMTLGTTANTNYTQLNLWFSSGATFNAEAGSIGVQSGNINLWGVQLEMGSVATQLEKPDFQNEIAECQRFYNTVVTYVGPSATYVTSYSFPVRMRAQPTVAGGGTGYGAAVINADNIAHSQTTAGAQTITFTADL